MGQAKARRNKFGNVNVHSPMEYFSADILVAVPADIKARDVQFAISEAILLPTLPSAFHLEGGYAGAETFSTVTNSMPPITGGKGDMVLVEANGQYGRVIPQSEMSEYQKVPGYHFTFYRLTSPGEAIAISGGQFISAVDGLIEDPFAFSIGKVRKSGPLVTIADRPFSDQLIGAIESDLNEDDVATTIAHAMALARWSEDRVGVNRWANADLDFFLSFMSDGPNIFAIDPDEFTGRNAAFATVVSLGDHLITTPFIEAYLAANQADLRVWRPRQTDVQNIWADFHRDARTLSTATGYEFDIPDLAARTSVEYAAAATLAPEKVRDLEAFLGTGKIVAHLTGAAGTMELLDFGEDMLLVLTTAELKEMVTWSKSAPLGRTIKLSDEMAQGFKEQMSRFEEKFGRPAGPKDPVFFDPNADTPTRMTEDQLTAMMMNSMFQSGFPKQFIYAYEKLGYIVTPMNLSQWSQADVEAWDTTVKEYEALVARGEDPYATRG